MGDPIYRDFGDGINRWRRNNPRFNPADNNPCNNDNARCLVGPHNYPQDDYVGTLLKYDENSEFRKITLRAFFNMPEGQQFDCRAEELTNIALPKFSITSPRNGQTIRQSDDPNRTLTVKYSLLNEQNAQYYKIRQINVFLDNRLRSTTSINVKELVLAGISDGRHTLKMEMLDDDGKLVAGTQAIVLFGYEYARQQTEREIEDELPVTQSLVAGVVYKEPIILPDGITNSGGLNLDDYISAAAECCSDPEDPYCDGVVRPFLLDAIPRSMRELYHPATNPCGGYVGSNIRCTWMVNTRWEQGGSLNDDFVNDSIGNVPRWEPWHVPFGAVNDDGIVFPEGAACPLALGGIRVTNRLFPCKKPIQVTPIRNQSGQQIGEITVFCRKELQLLYSYGCGCEGCPCSDPACLNDIKCQPIASIGGTDTPITYPLASLVSSNSSGTLASTYLDPTGKDVVLTEELLQRGVRNVSLIDGVLYDVPIVQQATVPPGDPVVGDAVTIPDPPDLSLNRPRRPPADPCAIACNNDDAERHRILENTYEYNRDRNFRELGICLGDLYRDGDGLEDLWNEWLSGGTADGRLSPGEPTVFPTTYPCCYPLPQSRRRITDNPDEYLYDTDPCPEENQVFCWDQDCLNYNGPGGGVRSPREQIWWLFVNSMNCKAEQCFRNSASNRRNGPNAPLSWDGPNSCLDDTQKDIDRQIESLKTILCVSRCNGPIVEDCPDKDPILIDICQLEALKRLRCDLWQINDDDKLMVCQAIQDELLEVLNAYRRSPCNGLYTADDPCDVFHYPQYNEDTGDYDPLHPDDQIWNQRIRDCHQDFGRAADRAEKTRNETLKTIEQVTRERSLQRIKRYRDEILACACGVTGVGIGQSEGPTLYPNFFGYEGMYRPCITTATENPNPPPTYIWTSDCPPGMMCQGIDGCAPEEFVDPIEWGWPDSGGWFPPTSNDRTGQEWWRKILPKFIPYRPY